MPASTIPVAIANRPRISRHSASGSVTVSFARRRHIRRHISASQARIPMRLAP